MNASWVKYLPEFVRERLEGRHQLQKAIGNSGWLFFDKTLRTVIALFISAWITRYLGPTQFGELSYALSFIAFFQIIATLEADSFIVRDISQNHEEPSDILGTALWLRLAAGTIAWLGAAGFMLILHPDDKQLFLLTLVAGFTMIFQAFDTIDLWFQSQSQSKRTVVAKFVAFLLSYGVKIVLLLYKAPLIAFAAVLCLDSGAAAVGLVIAYRRFPTNRRWRAHLDQAVNLLKLCWPYIISGLMITAYMRIDQIMLKEMLGEHELGIFAAAVPLSHVWTGIAGILLISLAPYVARKMVEGEEQFRETMARIFRFFALIALLGAIATAVVSPWIIKILYGDQYQPTVIVLKIHVFTNVFIFIGMAQHLWMINKNANFVNIFCTSVSAVVGILSNFILIKQFGVLGAAYSYLLVQATSVVITPCLIRKDLLDIYLRAFLPWRSARLT